MLFAVNRVLCDFAAMQRSTHLRYKRLNFIGDYAKFFKSNDIAAEALFLAVFNRDIPAFKVVFHMLCDVVLSVVQHNASHFKPLVFLFVNSLAVARAVNKKYRTCRVHIQNAARYSAVLTVALSEGEKVNKHL